MIMNREEDLDTQAVQAEKSWIEFCGYTLKNGDVESIFKKGAEWADAHPKEVTNDCKFCKQEEVVTHKSKECDLSYDGETLCVDVDIPLTWGSATGCYGFSVNYCPMCGRKLQ